jgi:hypothetical protein
MAGSPGTPVIPAPMTTAAGGMGAADPYSAFRIDQRFNNYGPMGGVAGGIAESMRGAATEMGYQPGQIGAPMAQATGYQASQLAGTSINPYMNPYTEQVIRGNERDILRGATMGLNQLGAQAQAARAFGGSRQAVTESELGRDVLQQLAQSSAGLRQQGFQQAQNVALQDIAAQNMASQFGAGAYNQASMQNAANMLAAQQANQQAGLAGSQQRLSAANQLGSLGNLGFGMVRDVNQDLMQQGMLEQAIQQALIDSAKTQYGGFVGAPQTALNTQLGAYAGSQTGEQTQTTAKQPGLFDYLQLGASFAS